MSAIVDFPENADGTVVAANDGGEMHHREELLVRPAVEDDAQAIAAIYNHYVKETIVTFEEEPVAVCEMWRRVSEVLEVPLPWLVAEREGVVAGYAYATRWKPRSGYRFSAEVTVYVAPEHAGTGVGSALYSQLLPELREKGIHAVIGGVALPNAASVTLHEKFGFQKVAHFEQTGYKFEQWIDVGYWELIL